MDIFVYNNHKNLHVTYFAYKLPIKKKGQLYTKFVFTKIDIIYSTYIIDYRVDYYIDYNSIFYNQCLYVAVLRGIKFQYIYQGSLFNILF